MSKSKRIRLFRPLSLLFLSKVFAVTSTILSPFTVRGAVAAEIGIGPHSILIGQSADFSGPYGYLSREFRRGAHYAFNQVNARGGIHGRLIIPVYRDDRYQPDQTKYNTNKFIRNDKVFALFGYFGTATTVAALPLILQFRIPFIAPVTGAQVVRTPFQPLIFHIRASYHREIKAILSYLLRYGRDSIAILYQDDAFGRDCITGVLNVLKPLGLNPVAMEAVSRNSTDTKEASRRIARAKPEAVIVFASYGVTARFIENLRHEGSRAQVFNLSVVGAQALSSLLPSHLRHGIGVSQIVPFPWNSSLPIVRDYQFAMRSNNPSAQLGFSSLEGYIAAQALITALEKLGPNPTREGLARTMHNLRSSDLGDFALSEAQSAKTEGSSFVELTFFNGRSGFFIH